MDAKKYIEDRMLRDTRTDKISYFLDTKTSNSIYNWLRLYLIRLELEKDWWDKYWNGKMMRRDLLDKYWDKVKIAADIIDEEYDSLFSSKEKLAEFLVTNDIPLLFVPHIWKVAIAELQKLIKEVYNLK